MCGFLLNVFVRRIICPCLYRVRSKRFCAEDRGFLSEAGQFPFGKPLSGVADPGCGFVSWFLLFAGFVSFLLAVLLLEVSFFLSVFEFVLFLLILVISGSGRGLCIYCDHGTHVWARQGLVLEDTPVQAPGPDLDQAEAWGSQWAVLQVNEEGYYALVHWCHFVQLRCGTIKVVHFLQVLAYPQEEGSCSVHPWGSVLPRGEGRVDAAVQTGASGARLREVRCQLHKSCVSASRPGVGVELAWHWVETQDRGHW